MPKRGKYGRSWGAWKNFRSKCDANRNTDVEDWNEYQFLGYVTDLTGMQVMPVEQSSDCEEYSFADGSSPRRHPQLVLMRRLIAKLHNLPFIPAEYNREKVKRFIDWSFRRSLGKVSSLSYWMSQDQFCKFELKDKVIELNPGRIDRCESIPAGITESLPHLKTFGDLSFYVQASDEVDWELLTENGITEERLRKVV